MTKEEIDRIVLKWSSHASYNGYGVTTYTADVKGHRLVVVRMEPTPYMYDGDPEDCPCKRRSSRYILDGKRMKKKALYETLAELESYTPPGCVLGTR